MARLSKTVERVAGSRLPFLCSRYCCLPLRSGLLFAVALMLSVAALPLYALGLGDIKPHSALNQEFNADIDLLSVADEALDGIRVRLASPEAFEKAGIERPFFLTLLKFRPERLRNGKAVIHVSSDFPIREPFLDFLIEVNWPKGRLIREYTVLLDPPSITKRRAPRVEAAPAAAQTSRAAPARKAEARAGQGEYGPVSPNETLWSIAKRLRPQGVSMEQMMIALWRANPDAFIGGDINRLRRGRILRVPGTDEVASLSRAEARQAYREAQEQWLSRRARRLQNAKAVAEAAAPAGKSGAAKAPESELRIATARPEGKGEAGSSEDRGDVETMEEIKHKLLLVRENAESSRLESESLRKEIAELRKRLQDMQHLLALKDEQLARLQAREAGKDTTEAGAREIETQRQAPEDASLIEGDLAAAADAILDEEAAGAEVVPPAAAPVTAKSSPATQTGKTSNTTDASEKMAMPVAEPPQGPAEKSNAAVTKRKPTIVEPSPETATPNGGIDFEILAAIGGALVLLLGLLGLRRWWVARKETEEPPPEKAAPTGAIAAMATESAQQPQEDDDIAGITADSQFSHEEETSFLSDFSLPDMSALRDETGEVDPVSEADVYIAYGRYQQAEDLLKQAMSRDPDRLAFKHKLLEVYYATRDVEAFNELAGYMAENGQHLADQEAWARIRDMGHELDPDNPLYSDETAARSSLPEDVDAEAGLDLDVETLESPDEFRQEEEPIPSVDLDSVSDGSPLALEDSGLREGEREHGPERGTEPLESLESLDLELSSAENAEEGGEAGGEKRDDSLDLSSLDLSSLDLGEGEEGERRATAESVDLDLEAQLDELSDLSSLERDLDRLSDDRDASGLDQSIELEQPVELDEAFDKGLDSDAGLETDTLATEPVDSEMIGTKLDLARAFLEMGDGEGARDILEEIRQEGNDTQRQEAEKLLAEID